MTTIGAKGWCPGVLKPMESGDGLLVRLRITSGILSAEAAATIADLATRHGNGHLDLSSRGNLQIRGVREETLPDLADGLGALDIVDQDAKAEAVRNVVGSPLAGLDPTMVVDTRPVVRALEAVLRDRPELHELPAKFFWSVDGGGVLPLTAVDSDVRFIAVTGAEGARFRVDIARAEGSIPIGLCAPEDVPNVAHILATMFLRLRSRPKRMRLATPLERCDIAQAPRLAPALKGFGASIAGESIGVVTVDDRPIAVGAGLRFGRMTADALGRLAEIAANAGTGELRLTPFRAILVPASDPHAVMRQAGDAGFVVEPNDPSRAIVACTGAPGCSSAHVPTLIDAARLAAMVPRATRPAPAIHLSGCVKGCARREATPITLVGRDGGTYGLVRNGTARDATDDLVTSVALVDRLRTLMTEVDNAPAA